MLARGRTAQALLSLAVIAAGVLVSAPAHASYLNCPPPGSPAAHQHCTVEVGSPPGGGGGGGNGGIVGGGTEVCHPRVPKVDVCWLDGLGWYNPTELTWYLLMAPQPAVSDPIWAGHTGGAVYIARSTCSQQNCNIAPVLMPPVEVWLPTPPEGFGGADYPLNAAAEAINALDIFGADITSAPQRAQAGGIGLVGLPVWLWTPRTPTTWGPQSATATIPGVSATAVAQAQSITWSMGDGHTVTCDNPGTPYQPSDTDQPSPTCGYRYQTPSRNQPNDIYLVTALTTWMIIWTATNGAHGWVTVTTTASTTIHIDEMEVVIQS